jgi:hypothetical protein
MSLSIAVVRIVACVAFVLPGASVARAQAPDAPPTIRTFQAVGDAGTFEKADAFLASLGFL